MDVGFGLVLWYTGRRWKGQRVGEWICGHALGRFLAGIFEKGGCDGYEAAKQSD